jgi:hypothetical protein
VAIWRIWRKNGQCILPGKWLNSLKEEESKHNTAAALREGQSRRPIGPAAKRKTPKNLTDKTDRTHRKNLPPLKTRTDKTDRTSEDDRLGLIATWSVEFGYVSLHDPTTGEWWDLSTTDAPGWAMGEARRRKELYKSGNQRAYRLTARDMEEAWKSDQPPEEGIVEEHPLEEGD